MAKDIVFESERYEKRQTFKRLVIPLAVLVGVIAAAVVAALIIRGSRGRPVAGGEDTPYPYTWTASRNGSVTIELDRAAAPGYVWAPAAPAAQMEIAEKQNAPEGKSQFILTSKEEGRCVLEFRLQRADDPDDCVFVLSALAATEFDGRRMSLSLLKLSGRRMAGVVRGGEDTLCPYMLRQDEDGDTVVLIMDMETIPESDQDEDDEEAGGIKKPAGWQCEPGDESVVEYLGMIEDGENTAVYLRGGTNPGRTLVRIWRIETGTELTIEFELDGNGALLPLEHSIRMGPAEG